MIRSIAGLLTAALIVAGAPALARTAAPPDTHFSDGAVGSAAAECGTGDLCASLTLADGDTIDVYNSGAGECQPFTLEIVRMHGGSELFHSQMQTADKHVTVQHRGRTIDCYQFENTFLTFDGGRARLGLFLSGDGSLFAEWSLGAR